jgi:hypothetical protein
MDRKKAVEIANLIYNLENIEFFEDELKQFLENNENSLEELDAELLKVVAKYRDKLETQLEEF